MDPDIRQLARDMAYDRYLRAVFAPKALQSDLAVLAAFYGEVARIPFVVREPLAGEVRLQWWQDSLFAPTSEVTDAGPLLRRMRVFVREHSFATDAIESIMEARQRELYPEPMPDSAAFEAWLESAGQFDTIVPARLLGISSDASVTAPLAAAGRAIAATDLALRLGRHVALQRVVLPLAFFGGRVPHQCAISEQIDVLKAAFRELHTIARRNLADFRAIQPGQKSGLKRATRIAILPVALIEPYFRALHGATSVDQLAAISLTPLGKLTRCGFYVCRRR